MIGGNIVATWTPQQAAEHLGVDVDAVQRLVDAGRLRALPVYGGGWVTTPTAVAAATRPRRRRGCRGARSRVAARPAPQTTAVVAQPTRTPQPEPQQPIRAVRTTPIDIRPDVAPNARLDMRAAAQALGVTHDQARTLARRGLLRASRLGREWVTTGRDVRAYVDAHRRRKSTPSAPPPRRVA